MRYGKYVIAICLILLGCFQPSFSYFENKVYCNISKDKVIISLDAKKSYTCNTYIRYIEVQMKKVYRDVLLIQGYIDKKQDLGYRNPLKEQKVAHLNSLQGMRLNILSHMKTFEENLFQTSKNYFLESIRDYQRKLNRTVKALGALQNSSSTKYLQLVQEELTVIEHIAQSTSFEQFNAQIPRYVYLKKQLGGK